LSVELIHKNVHNEKNNDTADEHHDEVTGHHGNTLQFPLTLLGRVGSLGVNNIFGIFNGLPRDIGLASHKASN
jgi:hypothetical protein